MTHHAARDVLVVGLRNAHAVESQAIELLERQASGLDEYPEIQTRVQAHLGETERQLERLEQAIAPYFAEHDALVVDARARTVDRTLVEELEPRFFRVRHTLVDPEDSRLWAIEGFVDVRERSSPDGVLFELDRIFA